MTQPIEQDAITTPLAVRQLAERARFNAVELRQLVSLAKAAGVDGRGGGWIYRNTTAKVPLAQGWAALADALAGGMWPSVVRDMASVSQRAPEPLADDVVATIAIIRRYAACVARTAEPQRSKDKLALASSILEAVGGKFFTATEVVLLANETRKVIDL